LAPSRLCVESGLVQYTSTSTAEGSASFTTSSNRISLGFGSLRHDDSAPSELPRKHRLCNHLTAGYLDGMSTVQEIEAAIPKLSRAELAELRAWFEDYVEDHLELTDDVKATLDESRREIAAGNYTTRQPQ
jgi:hypothetical protein